MKKHVRLLAAALCGLASAGTAFAGHQVFNFDVDPANDPLLNGALLVGNHNYNNGIGSQIWSSGAGVATNGFPATGGYLAICDATNANNNLVFVFPDVDNGLPVKGFQIEMDLRVGGPGTSSFRPADGFSVSFARGGDPVLVAATNSVVTGFAGGDSLAAARAANGSINCENGTKTGVSVVFDSWQGNWLPDTAQLGTGSNDREGIAVRLDDRTYVQLDLQANRSRAGCVQTNLATLSMQTGTNATWTSNATTGVLTYGASTSSGVFTNLCWQHLMVRLTNDPNPRLTVTWKGITVLNTNLPSFSATVGRLVLAGRCGGSTQNAHADNIVVDTTPTTGSYVSSYQADYTSFTVFLSDSAASVIQSLDSVILDGTNVTGSSVFTEGHPISTVKYSQANRFPSGSSHIVNLTWIDQAGGTNFGAFGFVTPIYAIVPTNSVIDIANVDQSKPGMLVSSLQTLQNQPNSLRWTEEQIAGLHGPNLVQASTVTLPRENNMTVWTGPLAFMNKLTGSSQGYFDLNSEPDLSSFGLALSYPYNDTQHSWYDNSTLEFFGYVYFPTSGIYKMVFGVDDNFQISVGKNPNDRLGQVIWTSSGSRLPNLANSPLNLGDIRDVIVDVAGVYPIRIVWENGGGGAGLEWYTVESVDSFPGAGAVLVNDDGTLSGGVASPIKLYRALNPGVELPPYVKKVSPVNDGQNVVYYQPIVIDLGDGNTPDRQVSAVPGTITLTVNGVAQTLTVNKTGDNTRIVQTLAANWPSGRYTNVLTFQDMGGSNYVYTWPFQVLGGTTGLAAADITNVVNVVAVPASLMRPLGAVNTGQPGFRVRSYQTPLEAFADIGSFYKELEGLYGKNVADQSATNGPGYFVWNNLLDFRYSSGTGAGGEWSYDLNNFGAFGGGFLDNGLSPESLRFSGANKMEMLILDVSAWLHFPQAGTYLMHFNSDDGFLLSNPDGHMLNKLWAAPYQLGNFNGGRGVAGAAGGVQTGGTFFQVIIPQAGAYPFHLVYGNGGTDGGLEWSVYQFLQDGVTVAKVPINDPNQPSSIKAYQSLSTGESWAPYVSFVNPTPYSSDNPAWAPIVVELTDAGGKAVNPASVSLKVDGLPVAVAVTAPSAGVTRIKEQLASFRQVNTTHTNVLVYADGSGGSYTNIWTWTVLNALQPSSGIVQVPASLRVDPSQVDHSKPGLKAKGFQGDVTVSANVNSTPNIDFAEQQLQGLKGPSVVVDAGLTNLGPGLYWITNMVDFAGSRNYLDQNGEYRYNYGWDVVFGMVPATVGGTPGTLPNARIDNNVALFGGWFEFPQAGIYVMTVNSDDGFKISVPYGGDPLSEAGLILGLVDGGRGNTSGGAVQPIRGSVSPAIFNIPQAGAYPVRMLFYNGTGGVNVEWTMFQYLPDGSFARYIVNDPDPRAVKAYANLNGGARPYVVGMTPSPANVAGKRPAVTLAAPAAGINSQLAVPADVAVRLMDGDTLTIQTNTITVTYNGIVQPVQITLSNGLVTVVRPGNAAQWWPSGQFGPLVVSFKDSGNNDYSYNVMDIATPFWGTLTGSMPVSKVDQTKPGFLVKTYAVDPFGGQNVDTRYHAAEQILAGLWGPNTINPANNTAGHPIVNGYFSYLGADPTNGAINFNYQGAGQAGSFQSPNFTDVNWPGIPNNNTAGVKTDNFVGEIRAYVEFPTNGTYILGVNSDDGFRLMKGTTPPNNIGALMVNSPAGIAGKKLALIDPTLASTYITSPITADVVIPQGMGYGSTTNGEGCLISNPGALAGKIAMMYRSPFCGYLQQVQNAVAAGAVGVILVQNPASNGAFPNEPGISPPQGIPAVTTSKAVGDAIAAVLATNGTVNVTLTPIDYLANPPADNPILGQADVGKGASDVLFPVVVQQAGVYPLRLTWFQGGGGANCEFFTLNVTATATNKVLINDLTKNIGPGPNGTGLRAWTALALPTVAQSYDPNTGNITITYSGILQSNTDLANPNGWADVNGANPPTYVTPATGPQKFYRAYLPQ
jgi:hypothetical protein